MKLTKEQREELIRRLAYIYVDWIFEAPRVGRGIVRDALMDGRHGFVHYSDEDLVDTARMFDVSLDGTAVGEEVTHGA